MPDQSLNLTALRGAHSARVYVSVMTGDVVLTATASSTPSAANATDVAISVVSGSEANVVPGMRVVVETAGGAYKGTLSVRYAGTISSTNLPVREFSAGQVQVASGDVLKVYNDFVLTDKLVAADETFAPDHLSYSDQHADPPPVCCSGGWWAGWLPASGSVAIPLVGSTSYAVDTDSGGGLSHLWTASGGTFDNALLADPTLTISAAGKYLVTHTVTDSSNGKTETQYIRIRVHDSADLPYDCLLSSLDGDAETGFRATFALFENTALSVLPDGAPVVVWADESIGGTAQSFGSVTAGRSHILCAGFFRRDTARAGGDDGLEEVEFEVASPLARLAELPGFSKVMLYEASPDAWNEIRALTVKRALIALVRYYTNALTSFDLIFSGFSDADYAAFYLQKQTPLEQVRELADSRDARLVCDRTGRLEVQRRLELTPLGSRAAVTTTVTLTEDDLIDYEMRREHYRPVETFRARGVTAGTSANEAAFARFPASPALGNTSPVVEKLIVDSVDDLFARCALRGAWEDRAYFDANGVQRHAPELTLTLFGAYARLFQFYREWVAFSGLTTLRGVTLADFRWLLISVAEVWEDGTATTTLRLQAETAAPASAAVDDTPPAETTLPPLPPIEFPPVATLPSYDGLGLGRGVASLAGFNEDGYLYRAIGNYLTTMPTWTRIALGLNGTLISFAVDPFSPRYLRTGTTVNGWIMTSTKIYSIADIGGAATVTERHTFANTVTSGFIETSIAAPNWVLAVYYNESATNPGTYAVRSTNGTSFTEAQITANRSTQPNTGDLINSYLSIHTAGVAFTTAFKTGGNPAINALYKTTDYGATWAEQTGMGYTAHDRLTPIHFAWHANSAESLYWHGATIASTTRIYRVNGGSVSNISPSVSGSSHGARYKRSISACIQDRNSVAGLLTNESVYYLFTSRDMGTTWTQRTTSDTPYKNVHIPDDRDTLYLWGDSGAIGLSNDFGATILSKKGNIASMSSPSPGTFVNIAGL